MEGGLWRTLSFKIHFLSFIYPSWKAVRDGVSSGLVRVGLCLLSCGEEAETEKESKINKNIFSHFFCTIQVHVL